MNFAVEGRYFPNSLYAFTFAQIQADRMNRVVEVHTDKPADFALSGTWHATAYPSNYMRAHVVKQPPGILAVSP